MGYTLERDEQGRMVFRGPGSQIATWEPGSGFVALGLSPQLYAIRLADLRDMLEDIAAEQTRLDGPEEETP